jgi:hypothetical protein
VNDSNIYRETERQRDRETERQRDREREREREKEKQEKKSYVGALDDTLLFTGLFSVIENWMVNILEYILRN